MCTTVLAYRALDPYPLIILHNRDEFYDRASEPLGPWPDRPDSYAGRDLKSGGMWFGISPARNRLALITNYRDRKSHRADARSRGEIVRDFVLTNASPAQVYLHLEELKAHFNPFNLIFGSFDRVGWYCSKTAQIELLDPGVHGLSNHLLNTPWYKVRRAKMLFKKLMGESGSLPPEELCTRFFALLADSRQAKPEKLPNTGLSPEQERLVSSIFIRSPAYGTVSSTVLLVDRGGRVLMRERRFGPDRPPAEVGFDLRLGAS